MRFRRRITRRRRHGLDMIPFSLCGEDLQVAHNSCETPTTHSVILGALTGAEILSPSGSGDTRIQSLRKGLMVRGVRFHWNVEVATAEILNVSTDLPAFFTGRVGLVKLAIDSTGFPVLLPNLYSNEQSELGDVLWRGAFCVSPINNLGSQAGGASYYGSGLPTLAFAGSYSRTGSHSGPEVVKTARRLDANEALFWTASIRNPRSAETPALTFGFELFGVAAVRSYQK